VPFHARAGRGRRPRALSTLFLVAMAGAAAVVAAAPAAAVEAAHGPGGVDVPAIELTGPPSGELTAADRDLVVKVRLAGAWERPAGRMAARKGVDARVRAVGSMIESQHGRLDELAIEAARVLGVPLPTQPNADQQVWLREMAAATGPDFDQVFVTRLRAAHGKIFPVIADVRTGTRNDVVRKLAQEANQFVLTHLTLLESTGLVDHASLPLPQAPSSAAPAGLPGARQRALDGGVDMGVIWVVVLGGALVGVTGLARAVRPRGPT